MELCGFLLQICCNKYFSLFLFLLLFGAAARGQEPPYFVTYSDALEEPGNLEIAYKGIKASPKTSNTFNSGTLELEYGVNGWWTTEVYLNGQITQNDSTVFTGFRWDNLVRPFLRHHFINPVLYAEFENINGADGSFLQVLNHDSISDVRATNADGRADKKREMELKLILSSNTRGWNISENFISEKKLNQSGPWEFGYALGVSRPLTLSAGRNACLFCRENFVAGLELYGGLRTTDSFCLSGTSHYLGPNILFNFPKGPSIGFEPSFGENANSGGVLWRFKVSYEIEQIFSRFRGNSH